jgi:hypothetical protein
LAGAIVFSGLDGGAADHRAALRGRGRCIAFNSDYLGKTLWPGFEPIVILSQGQSTMMT